jgi:HAD superfamily hydrolase (TIGR01484 family)
MLEFYPFAVLPTPSRTTQSTNLIVPILATDLDGTLIPSDPLDREKADSLALKHLSQRAIAGEIEIVFVTGRHFQSVMNAVESFHLPRPRWIVCDVGSSLYQIVGTEYQSIEDYQLHLHEITANRSPSTVASFFTGVDGLRMQEAEKQTVNKLSYYCEAGNLKRCVGSIDDILRKQQLPFSVIHSVDPFDGEGLIDIMPRGVNKAYALQWWCRWQKIDHQRIVFAGDSGNDFDALTSHFRGILVGNADADLAARIKAHHCDNNTPNQIYHARAAFTAGVLEGCHHYGVLKHDDDESGKIACP